MPSQVAGKIKLNDQEFYFLKGQYRKSKLPSVIPRFGSGDLSLSDLSAWSWWGQSIFDGGFQQKFDIDRSKFWTSSNIDHLTTKGQIQLARDKTLAKQFDAADTINSTVEGNPTAIYNGKFWVGLKHATTAKLFSSSDGSSFSAITTGWTDITAVKQIAVFLDKIYMACQSGGTDDCLQAYDDNGSSMGGITDFGGINCRAVGAARGKLYAAEFTNFTTGDTIRESSTGASDSWTDIKTTGGAFLCTRIIDFNNKAYFLFENTSDYQVELWVYDGVSVEKVHSFNGIRFGNIGVFNNILFISGQGAGGIEVYAFNESTVLPVFIENDELNPDLEYRFLSVWRGKLHFGNLVSENGFTFVPQYDLKDESSNILIPLQSFRDNLFFSALDSGSGKDGVYKLDTSNYVASGSLQSSNIDMGLFGVDKLFGGITIYHDPLTTGTSIEIKVRVDSTTAFSALSVVGSNSTVGSTSFDIEFLSGNIGKKIEYELTLKTSTTANTPKVQDVVTRYILLPVSKRVWDISVLAADNIKEYSKGKSGKDIENALWKISQKGVVSFVDRQGDVYDNKKTGTADRGIIFDDIRTEVLNYDQGEGIVKIRLIEG
tara:strand:+ start:4437 stop:6239 length:1803 start_codon:yes stop_codon:yes gene_type:complete